MKNATSWPAEWLLSDADAEKTSPQAVLKAALAYRQAGLSVIPIAADGSKAPDRRLVPSWQRYQVFKAREDELQQWFVGGEVGLAIIGGVVSGGEKGHGLEIIDFDTADFFPSWHEDVEDLCPGIVNRLVRIQSPRPGVHVYYRCVEFGGSQKLACAGNEQDGRLVRTTLIETKGEGGYCIVPPSPKRCHPSYRPYRLMEDSPPLTAVPTITPEERKILLDAARRLNRWQEPVRRQGHFRPSMSVAGDRPGDDFNRRASWDEILVPRGWTKVGHRGDVEDWQRPGKSEGSSATVNYEGSGLLYVFSSNADPFEDGRAYSKFEAYAMLEHKGDFSGAAKALKAKGYGGSGVSSLQ